VLGCTLTKVDFGPLGEDAGWRRRQKGTHPTMNPKRGRSDPIARQRVGKHPLERRHSEVEAKVGGSAEL
jgi:hypothetical protein